MMHFHMTPKYKAITQWTVNLTNTFSTLQTAKRRSIKLHYWSSLLSQFLPLQQFQSSAVPHTSQRCKSLSGWPQALDQITLSSCQRAERGVTAKVQTHATITTANTQLFQWTPISTCHKVQPQNKRKNFPPVGNSLADSWAMT